MFLKFFGRKSEKNSGYQAEQAVIVDGIDEEMNYCPLCKAEYRADIDHCMTCDVALINGREKLAQAREKKEALAKRSMQILPSDDLVNIRKGPLKDMKSLQRLLAQERVPSLLAGQEGDCVKGCCGPELYLQVKKEDLSLTMEILAKDFVKNTALDSHDLMHATAVFDQTAGETVCPACGCRFSPTVGACPECGLCFL
jgi:hypothetical protein